MKKITAVISGVLFAFIAAGSAQASDDEYYEHHGGHEAYEHGGYYNPYGYTNYGYNNGYGNHELREHGNRYANPAPIYGGNYYGSGYVSDDTYKYNNYGYNNTYRNHEWYEYRR